ncbi:SDR family NAD(P)-dependent oxidoreductase [Actinomadura nitritigenes]|uniref:SDR family NAD(P)-dependent oxidoreductase n=1 Tax=Actinomadura nitritigenes TaxID=134602 RepID=UPI003D92C3AD
MIALDGKATAITGAAGGVGSAAARAFARAGARVALLDLPSPALDAVAGELGKAGLKAPLDVTDEGSVQAAFARVGGAFGRLDALYVTAGVQLHGLDGPAEHVELETWRRTIEVNLTGSFLTVKHAVPLLRAAGSASVLICGSPTGITMSGRGYDAYAASKGGVMALARALAADYAAEGIRVNVIVPGTTRTPLIADLLDDETTRVELTARTPLGRLGAPEDLTGIAVFLASDSSSYATGATFAVDGGLINR